MKYVIDEIIKEYMLISNPVLFRRLDEIINDLSFVVENDTRYTETINNFISSLEEDILSVISNEEQLTRDMVNDEIYHTILIFTKDALMCFGIQLSKLELDNIKYIIETLSLIKRSNSSDKEYLLSILSNVDVNDVERISLITSYYTNVDVADIVDTIDEVNIEFISDIITNIPDDEVEIDIEFLNKLISLDYHYVNVTAVKTAYKYGECGMFDFYMSGMYNRCNELTNVSDIINEIVISFLVATDTRGRMEDYIDTHLHLDIINGLLDNYQEEDLRNKILNKSNELYKLLDITKE